MAAAASKPPLARPRASAPRAPPRPHEEGRDAVASDGPSRARALRVFVSCVAAGIRGVVSAFASLRQDELSFVSFKALWAAHRLSVLFHVEFWDSTPTDIHRAALQVAMDLLVQATEKLTASPDAGEPFVSLVGHCFALYCAYRVQLSEPKLRIAVDLSAWQALSRAVGCLTQSRDAACMGSIALEALAVIRRLEHDDSAFMCCLGGCTIEYRLEGRKIELRSSQIQPLLTQTSLPEVKSRRDESVDDIIMQLEALNSQYNSTLERLSNGINTTNTPATSLLEPKTRSRGRGQSQVSFLRRSRPPQTRHDNKLDPGLWTESRCEDSVLWLSQLRQSFGRLPSSSTPTVNGSSDEKRTSLRLDISSSEVDAALLALEQELVDLTEGDGCPKSGNMHAGLVEAASQSRSGSQHRSNVVRGRSTSVASSAYDSDGLAELEAELSQAVCVSTLPHKPMSVAPNEYVSTPKRTLRPRGRSASITSINTESDGLGELEAELAQNVAFTRSRQVQGLTSLTTVKRSPVKAAGNTVIPHPTPSPTARARQSTRASSFDSGDTELDFLQHELDAAIKISSVPPAPHPNYRATEVNVPQSGCTSSRSQNAPSSTAVAPRRSRRLSVASSATEIDTELLALQAELAVEPTITAKSAPKRNGARTIRKRPRAKSASSGSDEELKLLEGELAMNVLSTSSASPSLPSKRATNKSNSARQKPRTKIVITKSAVKAPSRPRQTRRAKQTSSTGHSDGSEQPPKRTLRSSTRSIPSDVTGMTTGSPTVMHAQAAMLTGMSSRRSTASSYDSDGLAELEHELQASTR